MNAHAWPKQFKQVKTYIWFWRVKFLAWIHFDLAPQQNSQRVRNLAREFRKAPQRKLRRNQATAAKFYRQMARLIPVCLMLQNQKRIHAMNAGKSSMLITTSPGICLFTQVTFIKYFVKLLNWQILKQGKTSKGKIFISEMVEVLHCLPLYVTYTYMHIIFSPHCGAGVIEKVCVCPSMRLRKKVPYLLNMIGLVRNFLGPKSNFWAGDPHLGPFWSGPVPGKMGYLPLGIWSCRDMSYHFRN